MTWGGITWRQGFRPPPFFFLTWSGVSGLLFSRFGSVCFDPASYGFVLERCQDRCLTFWIAGHDYFFAGL